MHINTSANEEQSVSGKVLNLFSDPKTAIDNERFETDSFVSFDSEMAYYMPPIPFSKLSKLIRVNPHHGALPLFKARKVASYMKPNNLISRQTIIRALVDFESTGNGFFKLERNRADQVTRINYLPTINTRRLKGDNCYGWIQDRPKPLIKFKKDEVIHIMQHDPFQQVYGIPYWVGGLQSILLGEDVRIYMRMFFKNGGSTGDILATAGLSKTAQDIVQELMDSPTGDNRFKRLLIQLPRGEVEKMLKVLPYSTGSEKIDYSKLAAMTSTDILEAWRIPPELAGMRPEGTATSGDLDKIKDMYYENEIVPIQQMLSDELCDFLGPNNPLLFDQPMMKDS